MEQNAIDDGADSDVSLFLVDNYRTRDNRYGNLGVHEMRGYAGMGDFPISTSKKVLPVGSYQTGDEIAHTLVRSSSIFSEHLFQVLDQGILLPFLPIQNTDLVV